MSFFARQGASTYAIGRGVTTSSNPFSPTSGATSNTLLRVEDPIASAEMCAHTAGSDFLASPHFICAGRWSRRRGTCQGDSGGPLIATGADGTSTYAVGVTSWGFGCAYYGFFDVFSKLSTYADFLIQNGVPDGTPSPQGRIAAASISDG